MWGQVNNVPLEYEYTGIIPMRVGTRGLCARLAKQSEDHPHACGDKKAVLNAHKGKRGSSPCVWGQVTISIVTPATFGIIPMRVGTRRY